MNKFFAIILSLFLVMSPVTSSNKAHASSGGGVGTYANIILGMGNGIVGSTILMNCKVSQPSIIAYMAGSLVYIAAEIAGGNKKKEDVKSGAKDFENTKNSMKEGGDLQRDALQKQLDNEKSNLDHAQKKKTWMTATLAVYAIATALAVIEQIYGITGADNAACTPGTAHIPVAMAITTAYVGANGYASGGLIGAAISVAMLHLLPKLMTMIGIGTGITNALVSSLTLASGRIVFFLAATVLTGVVVSGLSAEEGEIQKRIKKLEEALKLFDKSSNELAEGSSTLPGVNSKKENNTEDGKIPDSKIRQNRVNELAKNNMIGRKCFSNSSGSMEYSEGGCKNPLVISRPQINPQFSTPTLTAATNTAMDLAQSVANGDSATADVQAANLASMASKLVALKDSYVGRYNDQLKKEGKKPVDGNEEVNRRVAALENELKKQGLMKANSFAEIDQMNPAQISKDQNQAPASEIPKQEVITIGGDSKAKDDELKEEGLSEGDVASLTENIKEDPTLSSRLNEFEDNSSEISKDSGRSLFDQVSNRYIHSLPKLLKRRETPVPVESK